MKNEISELRLKNTDLCTEIDEKSKQIAQRDTKL